MDFYKLRAGINLALLFLFAAWCLAEYVSPYKGWWIQRTFFTPTFNFDVTVDVTYDGKPYRIERTIECYRRLTSSAFGSGRTYGYFSDYGTFGTEASTGEAIIVATPAVCDSDSRRWTKGVKATNHNWHVDIPENHIPLLMVADSLDNPQQVIIYASKEAYKSPHARLQYIGMKIMPAKGMGRWFSDGRDEFSKFGDPKRDFTEKDSQSWWSVSYAPLGRNVWGHNKEITDAVDGLKEIMQMDRRISVLINNFPGYCSDFTLPRLGYGLLDGDDLRGEKRDLRGRCPHKIGISLYQELIPFVLTDEMEWIPDSSRRGMNVLYNSMKTDFNKLEPSSTWTRTIKIDEDKLVLIFEPLKIDFPTLGYKQSSSFYVPGEDKIYQGVGAGLVTYDRN